MGHKDNAVSSKETIREATLADRQDVLDLDTNVYYGLDYLRNNYEDVLKNPKIKSYVYENNGLLVGFLASRLIDGGETLYTSSGRLGHSVRGTGMYGRFKDRVLQQWRRSRGLRHVAQSINNYNMASKSQRVLKQYRQIMVKDITVIDVNMHEIRADLTDAQDFTETLEVTQFTYDDVKTMLRQHPKQLRHLFPEERILLQWCPFRITEVNAPEIFNGHHKILTNVATKPPNQVIPEESPYPVHLISAGGHYSCSRGRNYDVDIFGNGNEGELRAHLKWHLRNMAAVGGEEKGVMRVYFSRRVEGEVRELQKEFAIQLNEEIPFTKTHALEMDFPYQ